MENAKTPAPNTPSRSLPNLSRRSAQAASSSSHSNGAVAFPRRRLLRADPASAPPRPQLNGETGDLVLCRIHAGASSNAVRRRQCRWRRCSSAERCSSARARLEGASPSQQRSRRRCQRSGNESGQVLCRIPLGSRVARFSAVEWPCEPASCAPPHPRASGTAPTGAVGVAPTGRLGSSRHARAASCWSLTVWLTVLCVTVGLSA